MSRLRRRFTKTGVAIVAVLATLVLLVGVAVAALVTWTGQGAPGGVCQNTTTSAPNVPPGQQQWLFILTQPDAGPTWQMTFDFNPDAITASPVNGVQMGGGAVHFTVFTPAGAVLQSASTNDGNDEGRNSNLTVSHCAFGATSTSTTSTSTTSTSTTSTSTTSTSTTSTSTTSTSTTTTTAPTTTTTTTTTTAPTTTTTTTAPTTTTTTTAPTTTTTAPTTTTVPKTTTTTAPSTTTTPTTSPTQRVPTPAVAVVGAARFTG